MHWYSFSSAVIIFIQVDFSQAIFCSMTILGHFLILSNSRTFPRPGKLIGCFPQFPERVGTLIKSSAFQIPFTTGAMNKIFIDAKV